MYWNPIDNRCLVFAKVFNPTTRFFYCYSQWLMRSFRLNLSWAFDYFHQCYRHKYHIHSRQKMSETSKCELIGGTETTAIVTWNGERIFIKKMLSVSPDKNNTYLLFAKAFVSIALTGIMIQTTCIRADCIQSCCRPIQIERMMTMNITMTAPTSIQHAYKFTAEFSYTNRIKFRKE